MSIAPTTDIPVLAAATSRLLATVDAMREEQLAEPSLLPGWTRGHVLAHLARNADGLTNLLTGARTGVPTPMYPSLEAREHDIQAGAKRTLAEHAADLRASAARFDAAAAAMPDAAWAVDVPHRLGSFPAHEVVARRIEEVEYHHVDLGLQDACAPGDWPEAFVRQQLARVSARFAGREGLPSLCLVDTDFPADEENEPDPRSVHDTGAPRPSGTPDVTVIGPGSALLAWLTGRSDGGGLDVLIGRAQAQDPKAALPALPPLG
ncbi:maleylpyruvate isomerase family mycothiol-dependent enzyme [Streptacidiphilus jiangxiensis]|uniref:Maleylpyruvate isomerase n=1 Tax=Streptacidiphilus jiangxiensis TaxID=235985 RepID=A0A1H7L370_STRJI|nr:maleylpyruvate isomerase family mycothiol-dependent enzyme [Streptacidiphilus jiangxiensis]SEK93442.1 maleylpyruvate isomerase [Streptacidiphilus jiangxiensis]